MDAEKLNLVNKQDPPGEQTLELTLQNDTRVLVQMQRTLEAERTLEQLEKAAAHDTVATADRVKALELREQALAAKTVADKQALEHWAADHPPSTRES